MPFRKKGYSILHVRSDIYYEDNCPIQENLRLLIYRKTFLPAGSLFGILYLQVLIDWDLQIELGVVDFKEVCGRKVCSGQTLINPLPAGSFPSY